MRSAVCEIMDLALTQALERYLEMDGDDAYDLIRIEWPQQVAVLLVEFLYKARCDACHGIPEFLHAQRHVNDMTYIVAVCGCDLEHRELQ